MPVMSNTADKKKTAFVTLICADKTDKVLVVNSVLDCQGHLTMTTDVLQKQNLHVNII